MVAIGEEFSKLALQRIKVVREQKVVDPYLYEIDYWDSSVQYFSDWANRASQPGEVHESDFELAETLENLELDTRE